MRPDRKLLALTVLFLLACGGDATLPVESDGSLGSGNPSTPPPPPPPAPLPPEAPSVWLADADGQHPRILTAGGYPAWAPDGGSLLIVRSSTIIRVDTAGREIAVLASGRHPAWSPDGKRIAFTGAEGIDVMNADGTGARLLIPHLFRTDTYAPWDMGVGKPAWSPDGTRIAFEHLGDGDMMPAQIFVMNADGSSPRLLNNFGAYRYAESDPAWSPDGSRIVYWSYGHGIASTPADGGPVHSYAANFPAVAYGAKPAWSADATRIAFTANRFAGPQVWAVTTVPGPTGVLIASGFDAVWSPDGRRIAFAR